LRPCWSSPPPSRWRTGVTYRYSASRLAHGEGLLQAVEQTLRWSMSCAGRAVDIDEGLQNKLNEAESDRGDEIAWVAVRDASGLTVSGSPEWVAPQPERLRAVLATGKSDSFVVNTAQGEILPIRTHLPKKLESAGSRSLFAWPRRRILSTEA